ncbi:MAG: type VI secretion system tip protein VgrG [Piscinibacter sp.]|nr:type VI secretion system tip protein VgrG [Piscinibacter sp.]
MAIGGLGGGTAVLSIKTDLGDGKLMVLRLEGLEYLGKLSEYTVDLVGNVDLLGMSEDIDFDKLVGTRANVKMELPGDEEPRHFDAFVIRAQRGERRGRYESFTLTLRPWLWFLSCRRNSRVFQNMSVKDIVAKILGEYSAGSDHKFDLKDTPPKLDYCVQYDETDFDFVTRLLEEYGIYYYFEHTDSKHTMVMTDAMSKHKDMPGTAKIKWSNAMREEATMINFFGQKESRAKKAVVRDYDYLDSATKIEQEKSVEKPLSSDMGKMEVFEFPARVVQNQTKPDKQASTEAATQRALVVAEGLSSLQVLYTGTTNSREVSVGTTFELEDDGGGLLGAAMGALFGGGKDPKRAGKYLVVGAQYRIDYGDYEAIDELKSLQRRRDGFLCDVICANADGVNFRPEPTGRKPVMYGPQTAVVVGASGNEIETDKHGRVKVQFHWDREGKKDQDSSCWLRVVQPWASQGYGMLMLPRVGDEVVVSFIGGDPDRPLITGSVYNDKNFVAYELPKQATVSGLRTRSSKSGTKDTANELRFDDLKDKEYVWLQAQKEYRRFVKDNAFDMVEKNETVKVKLTRKEVIGENWYLNVAQDVMHEVGKDLHVKVAGDIFFTGAATLQFGTTKEMSIKTDADFDVTAKGKVQVKANGNIVIEAGGPGGQITLKAGSSSVVLGPAGVTIDGALVKVNCGGSAGAASPKEPAEAKNQEDLTPGKASDYDKLFEDPIVTAGGKVGEAPSS